MITTNRGRHRQDNDGNLFHLHIISDVSVTDRQVMASCATRDRSSQKGKESDEEGVKPSQKGKETDDQDTDREEEGDEQDHTLLPVTKRYRGGGAALTTGGSTIAWSAKVRVSALTAGGSTIVYSETLRVSDLTVG